jgi:hypothetical protein
VIVAEMTDNRGLMLPLVAVALLGRISNAAVCRAALYRSLARGFVPEAGSPDAGPQDKAP